MRRSRRPTTAFAVVTAVVLALAACGTGGGAASGDAGSPGAVPVVTTTTVLADLVRQVGGERVSVSSLVPKGGEVHTFDPSPRDVAQVADARLVVANGLGLDDWLTGLATNAGTDAEIVRLGDAMPPDELIVEDGVPNPHLWLDPDLAARYARSIADVLGRLAPAHASDFRSAAEAYGARMTDLRTTLRADVDALPPDARRIVAFHDALPYLARALGLDVVAVVLAAPGQDPSAADLARVTATIRDTGARVIVGEAQFNPDLAQALADETGVRVVTDVYTDSTGDPPTDTVEGIIRWDAERITEALR